MSKKIKPVTPGLRFRIAPSFDDITTSSPEKSLLKTLKKSGGRNSSGKMTVRNVGGGHKRKIRMIDFKRVKDDIQATVKSIEYDPNRSANIALISYIDGHKSYYNSQEYDLPPIKDLGQLLEVVNKTNDSVFLRIPDFGRKSLKEMHDLLCYCFPDDFRGVGSTKAIYTFKE